MIFRNIITTHVINNSVSIGAVDFGVYIENSNGEPSRCNVLYSCCICLGSSAPPKMKLAFPKQA